MGAWNERFPPTTGGGGGAVDSVFGETGAVTKVDYVRFDPLVAPVDTEGAAYWNDTDGTLNIHLKGNNVVLQVGQEQVLRAKNITGSTLLNGEVVYISGATGDRPAILRAKADSHNTSSSTIGVATESFIANAEGFITTHGLVRGLNTSGFAEGETLWLSASTAGVLTNVKPASPNNAVRIGWCIRSHINDGIIFVSVQDGYQLDDLSDVVLSAPSDEQVLVYDADSGYWVNSKGFTGKTDMSGFPVDSSGNYLCTLTYNETTRTVTITPTGASFDIFCAGTKYTKIGVQSIVHSAVGAAQFVYYNESGILTTSTTPWDLLKHAPVMFIFQDVVNSRRIPFEERHHAGRDVYWHRNQHAAEGTKATGSGFQVTGYTLNVGTDAACTFSVASGRIEDEDIRVDTQALPDNGPYTIIERVGASGDWQIVRENVVPFFRSGTQLQYNQNTGATWQRTTVANNSFANYYIFGVTALPTTDITPSPSSTQQYILIPGQQTHTTQAAASAEVVSSLAWGSAPFQEMVPLYKVTFLYQSAGGGTVRIAELVRIVGTSVSVTAAAQTDHGALTGLTDQDHPASAIIYTPTGNIVATDVQAALTELDSEKAGLSLANTFTAVQNINTSSTSAALTITQTGTGNALVVEDSASTDSTPFVIDADGRVVSGHTTTSLIQASSYQAQFMGSGVNYPLAAGYTGASATGPRFALVKNRSASWASQVVVLSGDTLGEIDFVGSDGTNLIPGARITAIVDGTSGTNDMPGRLVFSTTADGASTPTERMRIDSAGNVGISTTAAAGNKLHIGGSYSGATATRSIVIGGVIDPAVTTVNHIGTYIVPSVAAGTLPALYSSYVGQGTFTGTVTTHYGYIADNLTGATNNYGFYGNIAAGTGRYNFYAAGTADNYFGGPTTISVNSTSSALKITQTGTGNALVVEDVASDSTPFIIDQSGNVAIRSSTSLTGASLTVGGDIQATIDVFRATADSGGPGIRFVKNRNTNIYAHTIVNNGDTLGAVQFFGSDGAANIQGASVAAFVDGTPGTNDMPGRLVFSTTADGASFPTERMRIDNGGRVGIGGAPYPGVNIITTQPITGNAISSAYAATGIVQSDVTNRSDTFISYVGTQAATFTLGNLRHFGAYQATIGAGSTVTTQCGFFVDAGLVGATNNFGFYSNIASGTGRYNFYAAGTAQNYFAANINIGDGAAAQSTTNQDLLRIRHSNSGGVVRAQVINPTTASGSQARFDFATGTANAYGILAVSENGSGAATMELATGAGVSNGMFFTTVGTAPIVFRQDANERMRIGTDGGVSIGTTALAGANTLRVVNTLLGTDRLEVNSMGTGNRYAFIDLVGDDTYTDYGARFIRDNSGANAATQLVSRGTGDFTIKTTEAGALSFATSNAERLRISSVGHILQTASSSFVGMSIRNMFGSGSVTSHSFVDFQNELAIVTGSIVNVHATDGSSRVDFAMTPSGARNSDRRATVLQIYGNGNVLAISPNGGLGYGTGAGGTVTQVTSKSTAVTLNKPTGQITMNNAALAAGASVIFGLNNSLLGAYDSLLVQSNFGTNSQGYVAQVTYSGTGLAYIRVTNITGGSLSEAVTLTFAIIKGATA